MLDACPGTSADPQMRPAQRPTEIQVVCLPNLRTLHYGVAFRGRGECVTRAMEMLFGTPSHPTSRKGDEIALGPQASPGGRERSVLGLMPVVTGPANACRQRCLQGNAGASPHGDFSGFT